MKHSVLFLALACAAALLLPACGDSGALSGGVEGTWVIDKGQFESEVMKMLDSAVEMQLSKMPEAAREQAKPAIESAMAGQREAMQKAVSESDFEVEIKSGGTWTSKGSMMGDSKVESGTWKLDGDQLTISTPGQDDKPAKDEKAGTFSGDKIEMHIEEGPMKATLRLIRK